MKVKFISLASGSSGNCYYLGTETYGILIDAGIGIRTIKKVLKDYNILMDSIRAVFITHDHADHIKAVGNLGEKMNIPVFHDIPHKDILSLHWMDSMVLWQFLLMYTIFERKKALVIQL